MTPTFQQRNEAIRQTKLEFNDIKIQRVTSYDTDDHGWIPCDPIDIEPARDAASGLVTGMEAVTTTFARYLDAHPVYIHPQSAVAGAWAGNVPYMDDPWRPEERFDEAEPLWEHYNIRSRGHYAMNHSAPDMAIGLELGWGGLLTKIRIYRDRNAPAAQEFYDGEERLVLAIQRFIQRHVDYARVEAAQTGDEFVRQNLTAIADMNQRLVNEAPRTLREAVQFVAWFQMVDRMYYNGGALQQSDELFRPYYEADKANGIITDEEEVVWYLVSLLFNDTHYHQIAGPHPADGHDLSSPMSWALLEAMHRLRIPANVALRIHPQLDEALFDQAVEYLFEDGTGVSYSCSGGLEKGFMRNGHPLGLARMRAKVGCNWTALPGIEYCLQDVHRIDTAKAMLLALDDMMATPERSMEAWWTHYEKHIRIIAKTIHEGLDRHVRYKHLNKPEVVLNLFAHGPIERGLDMSCGGVDILDFACDGVSLATVADSFAAVQEWVVDRKALTWEALYTQLQRDFPDEQVRLMLKSSTHFGAGGIADEYAQRVVKLYADIMRGPTPDGHFILPGTFSHGDVFRIGEELPATPNGRHAGSPVSHSADPDPGFLPGGASAPTAKANAVAKVQSGYGNSTPLQVDIDSQVAREMGGREIVKTLIRAHNDMGGTLVNINVVSKEKILEAHANPEKYPDLVVRVTGYSAFFKSLSAEYRQQVVDRWLGT